MSKRSGLDPAHDGGTGDTDPSRPRLWDGVDQGGAGERLVSGWGVGAVVYAKNPRVIVSGEVSFEDWQKGPAKGTSMTIVADHVAVSVCERPEGHC